MPDAVSIEVFGQRCHRRDCGERQKRSAPRKAEDLEAIARTEALLDEPSPEAETEE